MLPPQTLKIGLVLLLLGGVMAVTPARADFLILTGETWNDAPVQGTIPTPSGVGFDIDAERLQRIGLDVESDDLLVFDLVNETMELVAATKPAELLREDAFLQAFSRELEVQRYTDDQLRFVCGPSDAEMEAAGALTWIGLVSAPPGAGGGPPGGGGSDFDGDGVTDSNDNCLTVPNPNQDDNDGDLVGDACDSDDDNDGLSDLEETGTYGTNPFLVDTDGDGYSDFDEVTVFGTDPLDPGSFPGARLPALGLVGWIALSLALLCLGYRVRKRRFGA